MCVQLCLVEGDIQKGGLPEGVGTVKAQEMKESLNSGKEIRKRMAMVFNSKP